MATQLAIQIGREMLFTALLLAFPTVAASLAIGLVISIFQTVTSIQEQTLAFAPRIMVVGFVLIVTMPWTLHVLITFTQKMFVIVGESGS